MVASGGVRGTGARWSAGRLICLVALALLVLATGARAATITVTTTADDLTPNDGTVSLREAITAINDQGALGDPDIEAQNPGTFGSRDRIDFDIAGAGRQAIAVGGTGLGALPAITQPVLIDGYTQPGAAANTLAAGDDASLMIALNGTSAGSGADGLLASAPEVRIGGLDVFGFSGSQIELAGGADTVAGNELGFDAIGGSASSVTGVTVTESSTNTIGGTQPLARNVISGNLKSGVVIAGTVASPAESNNVQGNYIGTGPGGATADGNARSSPYDEVGAVLIDGGSGNSIGGAQDGAGNVISGNGAGVNIRDGGQNNVVQGNLIGVAADGHSALPNLGYGVRIGSSGHLAPPDGPGQPNEPATSANFVGAVPGFPTAGTGNVIAFNRGDGVLIDGVPQNSSTQREDSGNAVLSNSIYSNAGRGIRLRLVSGGKPPNNLMTPPRVTAVTAGSLSSSVKGTLTLSGRGGVSVYVELYASSGCWARGQGETLLGSATARTDRTGRASFRVQTAPLEPGQGITATATNTTADPSVPAGSVSLFNTSPFSGCRLVPRPTATTLVCRPARLTLGGSASCTATVRDTGSGRRWTPTGRVRFSSSAAGSFSHRGACRLAGGRCTVVYRPSAVGSGRQRISVRYGGDALHSPSRRHTSVVVRR